MITDKLIIYWRGKEVGVLTNVRNDMAYFDGTWESNQSDQAVLFEKLVHSFDINIVFNNLERATAIECIWEGTTERLNAIALGMLNGALSIRMVYNKESLNFLLENKR